MIDLLNLKNYTENNRIEAKKATGGFPQSIWETYSAFANTLGGVILLGVQELPDHSLRPVDLPHAEAYVSHFWQTVNDESKISANILRKRDVAIKTVEGKRIIVVTVPKANPEEKPIYIGGNALTGTYRRSGEGDYKCAPEQVQSMLWNAKIKTADANPLPLPISALNPQSVNAFRAQVNALRYQHTEQSNENFLCKIGAAVAQADATRPTIAGLLAFGFPEKIKQYFPSVSLTYTEALPNGKRYTLLGENVYHFYTTVSSRLAQFLQLQGIFDDDVFQALTEAFVNCLTNADYAASPTILVQNEISGITFTNAGRFCIDVQTAKAGGVSEPRNGGLIHLFYLIDASERAGNGIPHLFSVWKRNGWATPDISERLSPDYVNISLSFCKQEDVNFTPRKLPASKRQIKELAKRQIITFLTERITATTSEISAHVALSPNRVRVYLAELAADGIVTVRQNSPKRYCLTR